MGDRPTEGLPFDLKSYSNTTESVGSVVYLPDDHNGEVLKVSKKEYPYENLCKALGHVIEYRNREQMAMEVAGPRSVEAIVPQSYVLTEGSTPGTTNYVRVQKYTEGVPLKELGYKGVMNLEDSSIETLRSLLLDSMKCYLRRGVNYDLVGSDERDAFKKSRTLNFKRLMFPLRNSSNLFKTNSGIKLIDPNVVGKPNGRFNFKVVLIQGPILFMASLTDYLILSGEKEIRKIKTMMKFNELESDKH